jgi:tetratricopeptide (TPR) repeat protein
MSIFSPEHMSAYNTKAAMYREEGRYSDARDLLHHGLRSARDQLGEDSEVTLSMMHNYGSLLTELDKADEAAPLLNEALERRIEMLGTAHNDTASTMANLAVNLVKQGRMEEAISMRIRQVAARKQIDAKATETLDAIDDLCLLYIDQDKLEDAVPLVVDSMEHFLAELGPGCKERVPQKAMTAASQLYTKLLDRGPLKNATAEEQAMGKRLVDALMSVVGAPRRPAAAAPAQAQSRSTSAALQSPEVKALLADPAIASALQTLKEDPEAYPRLIAENPDLEGALQKLALSVQGASSNESEQPDGGNGGAPAATGSVEPARPSPASAAPAAPAAPPQPASAGKGAEATTMSGFLESVGLPQYVAMFEEEEMELEVLREALKRQGRAMVEDILKEIGVKTMGHRTRIINALA